ncbi:MAG: hypothetical protein KAT35_00335, partial [Candidatus Aenigmarchaeota archaeon]|nr:hypothetical protein [Candidatus Aenigmarchaeota archaeon]
FTGLGKIEWFTLDLNNMTRELEGFYTYSTTVGATEQRGTYLAVLKTVRGGVEAWDFSSFRISSGGPYDVIINLLENEVPPGDYLDFELTVWNKGEVEDQDVLVEYWVSDGNQTWYYTSESINVPPGNMTFPRSAFISSVQPLGQYFLNVKVTYDPAQPQASANESFFVVEPPPTGPPPDEPGGEPPGEAPAPAAGGEDEPEIKITSYPNEIGIETGFTKYPVVEIENTGGVTLYNVELRVAGVPSAWFTFDPQIIDEFKPGENATIQMKITIPVLGQGQEYTGTLTAMGTPRVGNITTDQKSFGLVVFTSRDQLVQWEIDRLKKALQEFEGDVQDAKDAGKDISAVEPLIDQIKDQITTAENLLKEKRYDDALNAIYVGWTLLERARGLLAEAPFVEILITTIFPPWLIAILVILVVVIVVLVIFLKK